MRTASKTGVEAGLEIEGKTPNSKVWKRTSDIKVAQK